MKTKYKNITDILGLNRFIVLAVVILCLLTSSISLWMLYWYNEKMYNSAFAVNTDGTVLPLKLVDQKENLEVEAMAHVDRFHNLFYGLDAANHRSQLDKALWLGDSSVDEVYRQKKADGVYNRLLQFSLRQEVVQVDIDLELDQQPYRFQAKALFEIHRGSEIDRYELQTSGKLVKVDRNFPHNPHGLLITEYYENLLQKLELQKP